MCWQLAHLFLGELLESSGKFKGKFLQWGLFQQRLIFVVPNQTQRGGSNLFHRPLAFIRCKYQIPNPFSFLYPLTKCIEFNTSSGLWQISSYTGHGIREWHVLPGIGTLASEDTAFWLQAGLTAVPDGLLSPAWLPAPFPTCIKSAFTLEWPPCFHWMKTGGQSAWEHLAACFFPPSSASGPKVNFAVSLLLCISQQRPTVTYSMGIFLVKIGYYSE